MKELKAYKKVALEANESKTISFTITEKMLEFWSENGKFEAESGSFTVWVSESSNVKNGVKFRLL